MTLGMAVPAYAESVVGIEYLNEEGVIETAVSPAAVTEFTTELNGGAYVVSENVTVDHCIYVSGDVLLILTDGHSLTVNGGIGFAGDPSVSHTLTITSQSLGDTKGSLTTDASKADGVAAGIGTDKNSDYHNFNLVINGGHNGSHRRQHRKNGCGKSKRRKSRLCDGGIL